LGASLEPNWETSAALSQAGGWFGAVGHRFALTRRLLAGLGAAAQDTEAIGYQLDIGYVQGDQFGAAGGASEGEHQPRPIAQPGPGGLVAAATMRRSSSIEIPALLAWAVPIVRRLRAKVPSPFLPRWEAG
jgi:hypothetical protein